MAEIVRGKIQKSDLLGWDGKTLTGKRIDATGRIQFRRFDVISWQLDPLGTPIYTTLLRPAHLE